MLFSAVRPSCWSLALWNLEMPGGLCIGIRFRAPLVNASYWVGALRAGNRRQNEYVHWLTTLLCVKNCGLPRTGEGDPALSILCAPRGSSPFIASHVDATRQGHALLLERLHVLEDLESSWLLLLFCYQPRSNYLLRMLPPHSATLAPAHDASLLQGLARSHSPISRP